MVAGLKGCIVASFFLAGVPWGPWEVGWWGVYVPRFLPLFLGGLPALPCGMVLSCRLEAYGGLLRSVGGGEIWGCFWGCMGFSWPVFYGSWAISAGGWVLLCTFIFPVAT